MFNFFSKIECSSTKEENEASTLLKQATALKREKKLDEAIEILRKAYKAMAYCKTAYGIEVHLRLPSYLYMAGRKDEAWEELNKLLIKKYSLKDKLDEIYSRNSTVYWELYSFVTREKKAADATVYICSSYVLRVLATKIRKSLRLFPGIKSKKEIIEFLNCKIDEKFHSKNEVIYNLMKEYFEYNLFDFDVFKKDIEKILNCESMNEL